MNNYDVTLELDQAAYCGEEESIPVKAKSESCITIDSVIKAWCNQMRCPFGIELEHILGFKVERNYDEEDDFDIFGSNSDCEVLIIKQRS